MTDLDLLAQTLHVSDRTLRRAAARGTIRCQRQGERLKLPIREALYLERQWPLIHSLVFELRTIPNVRLAVLFGSTARGDEHAGSDVDLLVRFSKRGLSARSQLLDRLEGAHAREVQLVEVEDANPLLLANVLREGRVLVDRSEEWKKLVSKRTSIIARAEADHAALDAEVWASLDELLAEAGS